MAKIQERVRVMTWGAKFAGDARLLTLTLLPLDWQQARMQVRDLVRRLRKLFQMEMAWAVEANPRGTGYHAHGIQWGTWMHNKTIQRMWGDRHIDIRRIKPGKSGYATKCGLVSGYLMGRKKKAPVVNTEANVTSHLAVNGNRCVHMTRGYLHGLTSREVLQLMSKGHEWHIEWASSKDQSDADGGAWPGYSAEAGENIEKEV